MANVLEPADILTIIADLGKSVDWLETARAYDSATGDAPETVTIHPDIKVTPPAPVSDRLVGNETFRQGDAMAMVGARNLPFRPRDGHRVVFPRPGPAGKVAIAAASTTVRVAAGDNSYNSATSSFLVLPRPDELFKSTGFAGAANNGLRTATGTPAAGKIVVKESLTDESAGAEVSLVLVDVWTVIWVGEGWVGDDLGYYRVGLRR